MRKLDSFLFALMHTRGRALWARLLISLSPFRGRGLGEGILLSSEYEVLHAADMAYHSDSHIESSRTTAHLGLFADNRHRSISVPKYCLFTEGLIWRRAGRPDPATGASPIH